MVDATSVDCEPFVPGPDGSTEIGKADLLVAALFSLTVLLRKIREWVMGDTMLIPVRSVYDVTRGPLGAVSDPALLETAVELEHWSETLPDPLRSHTQIPPSNTGAALIALMGDAVKYIFLRPFRYRVNVPSHVTYTVPDATWSKLIAHSHLTIAWFAAHGACMIDTWFVVAYCLGEASGDRSSFCRAHTCSLLRATALLQLPRHTRRSVPPHTAILFRDP
jgi:hypothetical protein